MVFDSNTPGQYGSAPYSGPDPGLLVDSAGSVVVEQKLFEVWNDISFRHPFRIRVLLVQWSDESHSRSVGDFGPYSCPLAPSPAEGVQPNLRM